MSFFPKEEFVPRRGVAMQILTPPPNLKLGLHRDTRINEEAAKIASMENKLATKDDSHRAMKVRTFKVSETPWAAGSGNIIAPKPDNSPKYNRAIGLRVPDEKLPAFYHTHHQERDRRNQQDAMTYARQFSDAFSPQKPDLLHKHFPPQPAVRIPPGKEIKGFDGLGKFCRDSIQGKAPVPEHIYDPLGLRHHPIRTTGVRRLPASDESNFGTVLHYDDGIPFAATQKKTYPLPHKHQPAITFDRSYDIPGMAGLGNTDRPTLPSKRKTVLTPLDHHNWQAKPDDIGAPFSNWSPSAEANAKRNYSGRVSAPI